MHAHATQIDGFAVQQDALALGLDAAETNAILDRVVAEPGADVVQARCVRGPKRGLRGKRQRADAVYNRHFGVDAQFRNEERCNSVHRIGQGHAGFDAVGAKPHEQVADEDRGQRDQRHIAIQAAMVEPIEMVHRHAIRAAAVIHRDLQPVFALSQMPCQFHRKRCRAAAMRGQEHPVQEHAGFVIRRAHVQDQPRRFVVPGE